MADVQNPPARDCRNCVYGHSFKARPDEQARYGFGETGYGCKHPVDGGVYVIDPVAPTCFRTSFAARVSPGQPT